jgi:hypothetical protein
MILSDVVSEVRSIIQDTVAPVRYSDTVLLGFANQTLKRMAVLRPDLFALITELATVQDQVLQSMPTDSLRVMEVFQVKGGGGITEASRKSMDEVYPLWASDPSGPTVNWMRHVRNGNRFFVYPRAPADQVLIVEYAQSPPNYSLGDSVALLPEAYLPVVVDGVVYLAESVDNEHVNSGRAQLFQAAFTQALGVGAEARNITDTEAAGRPAEEVI